MLILGEVVDNDSVFRLRVSQFRAYFTQRCYRLRALKASFIERYESYIYIRLLLLKG